MSKLFPNEGDLKKQVKKLLDKHGWFWWMPAANGYGKTGVVDFNAFRTGVFLVVETKDTGKILTPRQIAFCGSIRENNGFAFAVWPENLEYLEAWLGAFDRAIIAAQKGEKPTHEDGAMMLNAIAAMTETNEGRMPDPPRAEPEA